MVRDILVGWSLFQVGGVTVRGPVGRVKSPCDIHGQVFAAFVTLGFGYPIAAFLAVRTLLVRRAAALFYAKSAFART